MSANEARLRLNQLQIERLDARDVGLEGCAAYMADLERDIAACTEAFIGAAVTEIASLRGALSGHLHG